MSYSVDLRERVVNYVRNGGSLAAAAKLFQVGRATIYRWLGVPDLQPKPAKERCRHCSAGSNGPKQKANGSPNRCGRSYAMRHGHLGGAASRTKGGAKPR